MTPIYAPQHTICHIVVLDETTIGRMRSAFHRRHLPATPVSHHSLPSYTYYTIRLHFVQTRYAVNCWAVRHLAPHCDHHHHHLCKACEGNYVHVIAFRIIFHSTFIRIVRGDRRMSSNNSVFLFSSIITLSLAVRHSSHIMNHDNHRTNNRMSLGASHMHWLDRFYLIKWKRKKKSIRDFCGANTNGIAPHPTEWIWMYFSKFPLLESFGQKSWKFVAHSFQAEKASMGTWAWARSFQCKSSSTLGFIRRHSTAYRSSHLSRVARDTIKTSF